MGHHKNQQLRIIGGQWRGRKLAFPDIPELRPTPDRVRETVFNWLQADMTNSHCLDLFAGSGALGLEALSRGADSIVMVEQNQTAVNAIHENLATLNAGNKCQVVKDDALAYLRRTPEKPFDIVFLDPPFDQSLLQPCIELLEQPGWLAKSALIYIEVNKTLTRLPIPDSWQIHRSKIAGQVSYNLVIRGLPCDDSSPKPL